MGIKGYQISRKVEICEIWPTLIYSTPQFKHLLISISCMYGHFATKPLTKRLRKTYLKLSQIRTKNHLPNFTMSASIWRKKSSFWNRGHPPKIPNKSFCVNIKKKSKKKNNCQCLSYLDCCSFHGKINKEQTVFPSSLTIHSFIGKKGYTQWLKINFCLI